MKPVFVSILAAILLAACGGPPPPSEPYLSVPLADLAADAQLIVHGNGTGWATRYAEGELTWSKNPNGAKLQRFITTGTDDVYVAVFYNYVEDAYFGRDTFLMPAALGSVSGTTELGYDYTITRNDEYTLIYTLSGLFTITLKPDEDLTRYATGGFATGSSTGDEALQLLEGTALYSGNFIGTSTHAGQVIGDVGLTVNFSAASDQIAGTISNFVSDPAYTFNDLSIQATFMPEAEFDGVVTALLGTGTVFTDDVGQIHGGFYGPGAEEFGATIRIVSSSGNILSGAISGSTP